MSTKRQGSKAGENPVNRGRHERQCQESKRETGEVMSTVGGPAPVCPIVRTERFELQTFWLTAEFHALHPTTPTNYTQQNNRKGCRGFASLWLVSVALHGQKTDRADAVKMSAGDAR